MDHPIVSLDQKELRRRVASLLRNSYNVFRESNIVFVCGGNRKEHLRSLFLRYCEAEVPDLEIFIPEYSINNAIQNGEAEPFDLADFEKLISELSIAVVVFPEAAGSYAETGYFSTISAIAERCILALDAQYQHEASFLSLGPVKKIEGKTLYRPVIQLDYNSPDFRTIINKIQAKRKKTKKALYFEKFSDLSSFEISCMIHEIVRLMSVATEEDIQYLFTLIFKNQYSSQTVSKLISVLLGLKYLVNIGEFGHVYTSHQKDSLLSLREGKIGEARSIQLELANLYQTYEKDFLNLVKEARHAD